MKQDNNEEEILNVLKKYLKQAGFTDRKVTDTPSDSLQVVNRKFVTLNGVTANRPAAPVIGQRYFDTSIGRPIYWNGVSFVDAAGSIS